MAFELSVELDNGVEVTYHKVVMTNINWLTREAAVDVASYTSESQRTKTPMNPVFSQRYSYNTETFPFKQGEDPRDTAYATLKADPNFEGAKDV